MSSALASGEDPRGKFLAAWEVFARTCWRFRAAEASFQAWFSHYLISQFGIDRVAREISFDPRLIESPWREKFPGNFIRVDNVVTAAPGIDFPALAWLEVAERSGVAQLGRLAVVSELKVASTQGGGLDHSSICADVWKLSLLLHAAEQALVPVPVAFACVLDNPWEARRPYDRAHLVRRLTAEPPHPAVTVLLHDGARSWAWNPGAGEFRPLGDQRPGRPETSSGDQGHRDL